MDKAAAGFPTWIVTPSKLAVHDSAALPSGVDVVPFEELERRLGSA